MTTFRWRVGEPGRDYTRAGLAWLGVQLAESWCHDPDAFQGTIALYLGASRS